MSGPFEKIGGAWGTMMGNERTKFDTIRADRAKQAYMEALPWEPVYAQDIMPEYKKAESPVARSYLESMLVGANPDTTFSGSPNAAAHKLFQQQDQDRLYGTMQERVKRQAQVQKETPWALKDPAKAQEAARKRTEAEQAKQDALLKPGEVKHKLILNPKTPEEKEHNRYITEGGQAAALGVKYDVYKDLSEKNLSPVILNNWHGRKDIGTIINNAHAAGDYEAIKMMLFPTEYLNPWRPRKSDRDLKKKLNRRYDRYDGKD